MDMAATAAAAASSSMMLEPCAAGPEQGLRGAGQAIASRKGRERTTLQHGFYWAIPFFTIG